MTEATEDTYLNGRWCIKCNEDLTYLPALDPCPKCGYKPELIHFDGLLE